MDYDKLLWWAFTNSKMWVSNYGKNGVKYYYKVQKVGGIRKKHYYVTSDLIKNFEGKTGKRYTEEKLKEVFKESGINYYGLSPEFADLLLLTYNSYKLKELI